MEDSSGYSDDLGPDPGYDLIPGYQPYIADVGMGAKCAPFPVSQIDTRSEDEVDRIRHAIKHTVSSREFDHPVHLSDFCLVAAKKWDEEDSNDIECKTKICLLV